MKTLKTRHKKKQKNGGDMIEIGDDQKKGWQTEIPWQIIGTTASKTTFLWKIPPENTGKRRNPQESWQERFFLSKK